MAVLLLSAPGFGENRPLSGECLAQDSPAFDRASNLKLEAPTPELLTSHRFGLFSLVYPTVPIAGYPVTFNADGSVTAEQQFRGARWALENGELRLRDADGEVIRTFRYDARCNSLVATLETDGPSVLLELAVVRPDGRKQPQEQP